MLTFDNVSAHYGKIQALHNVSLHIKQGEIVTLIGANGAGKTTLLGTLCGDPRASSGRIVFDGKDITDWQTAKIMREAVAIVPEGRRVFSRMTVEENLAMGGFFADRDQFQTRIKWVYELFPRLHERRIQRAGTMSGGEQQMLAIGRALMSQPRLLLLDEPSLGLAPIIIQQIFDTIEQLREQGMTIFLVEQNANRGAEAGRPRLRTGKRSRGAGGHRRRAVGQRGDAQCLSRRLIHRNPASFTSPVCSPGEGLRRPREPIARIHLKEPVGFFCTCMLYNKRVQLRRFL